MNLKSSHNCTRQFYYCFPCTGHGHILHLKLIVYEKANEDWSTIVTQCYNLTGKIKFMRIPK